MIDKRFFDISNPIKLSDIQNLSGAVLPNPETANIIISGVAGINNATKDDIIFLANDAVSSTLSKTNHYKEMLKNVNAGACITTKELSKFVPEHIPLLIYPDPRGLFIKLQEYFYKPKLNKNRIMRSAKIGKKVKFKNKKSVFIGHNVVIEDNVEIGQNCYISHGAIIKTGCIIGDNCKIMENAVISHTIMGNNCRIGENSVIGGIGFGWHSTPMGHQRVPQLGRVIIKDNVEIDANSCIDRGAIDDTEIGQGTKIDNLVQIAHNNKIGQNCIFAGMSGIAGSNKIGNWVLIGAQAGLKGFITVEDNVQIAAQSGIMKDIKKGQIVMGYPALDIKDFLKQQAFLKKSIKKQK